MYTIPLDGAWAFRNPDEDVWMPATVPGCNYTDLLAQGKIPDPFVADHELSVRWVAEKDWEYRREFEADKRLLAHDQVFLECDGLDTIARVYLNGRKVAVTDNMLKAHAFLVTRYLRPGLNEIRICFQSPMDYIQKKEGKEYVLGVREGVHNAPFIRKAPCQFGWDWGPILPPTGIWRSIRLVGRNKGRLVDVHFRQQHRLGKASVGASVEIKRVCTQPLQVRFTLQHPGGEKQTTEVVLGPRDDRLALPLVVTKPELWWPNGYGAQPLYVARVELRTMDGEVLDVWEKRVGLRTIQLRREKDRFGESFTFVVNGVPIFAKGANWIPADSFPNRVTRERYGYLLESAARAHMNMIRVWGGGFYEEEQFYDLCDELGLLVWQDFMFACSIYPTDAAFVENVHQEVVAAVRRLRHRACLALWCGNNEMEQGWVDWGWSKRAPAKSRHAYDRMFHKLIPHWVELEDPDTDYWPSSASSARPFKAPNSEDRGDGHYWGVWHGREPFTAFRKHGFRFQTEFGFQSLPPFETVKTYAAPEDWNMTSRIMEHHQRSGAGNGLIIHYLTQQYRMPKDFEALCYLNQVLQAEGIRYGVEFWRRNCARTSGTIYWQLNDCWPVCSWASIDYFGRWKALHYLARRFFSPVLLSAEEEGTRVSLHLTNDLVKPFEGRVSWRLQTLDGEVLCGEEQDVCGKPGRDTRIRVFNFKRELTAEMRRRAFFVHDLSDDRGRRISRGMVAFCPYKHMEFGDPGLRAEVRDTGEHWEVRVRTGKLAKFVEVQLKDQAPDLIWSDNFFDLPAGEEYLVSCPKRPGESLAQIQNGLRIRSLRETY